MDLQQNSISRRDFLNTAAVTAAAVMAAGPVFEISGKEEPKAMAMKMPAIFVCGVCGHVEFGSAPEHCPVCHAPKEKFTQDDMLFMDAMKKFPDAGVSHDPVVMIKKEPPLINDIPCKEISARVGKKMHTMEEAHHIKFIDFYIDDKFLTRSFLNLDMYPAASYYTKVAGSKVRAVEYCTVHGYWQAESTVG